MRNQAIVYNTYASKFHGGRQLGVYDAIAEATAYLGCGGECDCEKGRVEVQDKILDLHQLPTDVLDGRRNPTITELARALGLKPYTVKLHDGYPDYGAHWVDAVGVDEYEAARAAVHASARFGVGALRACVWDWRDAGITFEHPLAVLEGDALVNSASKPVRRLELTVKENGALAIEGCGSEIELPLAESLVIASQVLGNPTMSIGVRQSNGAVVCEVSYRGLKCHDWEFSRDQVREMKLVSLAAELGATEGEPS